MQLSTVFYESVLFHTPMQDLLTEGVWSNSVKDQIKLAVSGHRSASKSVLCRAFFLVIFFRIFFFQPVKIRDTRILLEPEQISHTQSMVVKRGLTNRANIHTSV